MFFRKRPLLSIVLGGVAYAAACDFPQYGSALGLVALVPLIISLYGGLSRGRAFRAGFLFGLVASLGLLAWFWGTYPLSWAGVPSPLVGAIVIAIIWLVAAALTGLFFGFFAFLASVLLRDDWYNALIIPSAWVLMEFLRAFALSIFFLGSQSALGPDWTFGFLGYPLVWLAPFAALAPLGGVYLLSFAGVAANTLIAQLILRPAYARRIIAYALAVLVVSSAFSVATTPRAGKDTMLVALVSTDLPASFSSGLLSISERASALKAALTRVAAEQPDVIVLPEDSRALQYLGTTTTDRILATTGKETLLIDSTRLPDGFGNRETMTFYTAQGILGTSEKAFLMPYGEYLPYLAVGSAHLLGLGSWVAAFTQERAYERGSAPVPHAFAGHRFGALFCSEVVPESLYRGLAAQGADIFVNVASDADFHGNAIVFNQVLTAARMRAASNARFFLQATNGAPSFALAPDGETLAQGKGTLLVRAGFVRGKTLYTRAGDWPALLALGILIGFAWRRRMP